MLVDINHWYLRSFKGGLKANLTFPQTEVQLFWIDKYLVFFLLCSLPFPIHISILCSMNHRILLHVVLLHFTHLIPLLIVVSSSGLIFSTTVSSLSWNCGDASVALIYNPLQGLVNSCFSCVRHFKVGGDLVPSARKYWTVWQRTRQMYTRRVPEKLEKLPYVGTSFSSLVFPPGAWGLLLGWISAMAALAHTPGSCPYPTGQKAPWMGHGWRTCDTESTSQHQRCWNSSWRSLRCW